MAQYTTQPTVPCRKVSTGLHHSLCAVDGVLTGESRILVTSMNQMAAERKHSRQPLAVIAVLSNVSAVTSYFPSLDAFSQHRPTLFLALTSRSCHKAWTG